MLIYLIGCIVTFIYGIYDQWFSGNEWSIKEKNPTNFRIMVVITLITSSIWFIYWPVRVYNGLVHGNW